MVPHGDYVWINLDRAVMTTDVPPGRWIGARLDEVLDLNEGQVSEVGVKNHLVGLFYDELIATSRRRGLDDPARDPTPLVFVIDDRVPVETLIDLHYTAIRAERRHVFLFSGTIEEPRAVAIVHPPFCGVGKGINRFEADLTLSAHGDRLFLVASAREAGAPPGSGSPSAFRDPNELPIDVDGGGRCSLEWPLEGERLKWIQSELCTVSQGRPYVLSIDASSAALPTGKLVQLFETDLRPEICRSPIELDWGPPTFIEDPCARATPVMKLPDAFAQATITEPGAPGAPPPPPTRITPAEPMPNMRGRFGR